MCRWNYKSALRLLSALVPPSLACKIVCFGIGIFWRLLSLWPIIIQWLCISRKGDFELLPSESDNCSKVLKRRITRSASYKGNVHFRSFRNQIKSFIVHKQIFCILCVVKQYGKFSFIRAKWYVWLSTVRLFKKSLVYYSFLKNWWCVRVHFHYFPYLFIF